LPLAGFQRAFRPPPLLRDVLEVFRFSMIVALPPPKAAQSGPPRVSELQGYNVFLRLDYGPLTRFADAASGGLLVKKNLFHESARIRHLSWPVDL
jgi:hypothetical protein